MSSLKNITLGKYLQDHKAAAGEECTHTRIGDKDKEIFGGAYHIPETDWTNFMQLYYQHVIVKGQLEYLTEKQLVENGPIMIDIDLKYEPTVKTRQHNEGHILDALMEYFEQIGKLVDIADGAAIEVFVMEKSDVNKLDDKTKDGVHIIIGLQMHKALQAMLRTRMMPILQNTWDDLPVKNDWYDILDEGVTKGSVNWQLYGSRKPGHQAYMIKYHYKFTYEAARPDEDTNTNTDADTDTEEDAGSWSYIEHPLAKFSTEKNMHKMSARYTEYPGFPIKKNIYEAFEAAKKTLNKKEGNGQANNNNGNAAAGAKRSAAPSSIMHYGEIRDEATLDAELEKIFENIDASEYKLKEVHDYTMLLPIAYYGPGSYNKWIKVGLALRNESPKHFLTWLKFSCQDKCRDTLKGSNGKFDWSCVPELFQTWEKFNVNNNNIVTYKSIMYWAKTENREKFDAIQKDTTGFYVKQSLQGGTEFDLAAVLHSMKKDNYVCTSIKNKIWYQYINHRWHEIDSGNTLRMTISKEMHKIYADMQHDTYKKVECMDPGDATREKMMDSAKVIGAIATSLKKTQAKQNIMTEACLHFYDKHFIEELDKNTHLLCFNNGVVDFKQKVFRKGNPEDCLSKCTNIDYIPYETVLKHHSHTIHEIETFMKQLFPIADLEEYMWDHLASCLIGVNKNQTFNVYKGVGANGKSKLTDLMLKSLGTYAQSISSTMLTTKPSDFGKATPELARTPGVRYLIMAETTKGAQLYEGTMKMFSGGDEIPCRKLFGESETFMPQFKMTLMTNWDLEITANDDGTWRRLRYVDFLSKFTSKPYEGDFTREEYPYQFPIDEELGDKFEVWAPVFISMLVERAYLTNGFVKDCPTVLRASKKKREENDYLAGFVRDKVRRKEGKAIKKTELMETFKIWYQANNPGTKNLPKSKEIVDYMNLKFGECSKNGWRNTEIVYEEADEEEE
jgi:P4 family phage/plasmid primase-like protien